MYYMVQYVVCKINQCPFRSENGFCLHRCVVINENGQCAAVGCWISGDPVESKFLATADEWMQKKEEKTELIEDNEDKKNDSE